MKRTMILVMTCLILMSAAASWAQTNLMINGSFENQRITEGRQWEYIFNGTDGWTVGGHPGLIQQIWGLSALPDGDQCLMMEGATATAYLPTLIEPNTQYDFSIWLGADTYVAPSYSIMLGCVDESGYANKGWDGWITLDEDTNSFTPDLGSWTEIKLSFTTPAENDPENGGPIGRHLCVWLNGGVYNTIWTYFDNAVLTATPLEPAGSNLTGTVTLENFNGDITTVPVTVELNGVANTVNLDASGNFILSDIAPGTYDVRIKGGHWLAKSFAGVDLSADNSVGAVSLKNGDINGDGTIGATDLFQLRSNWGKTVAEASNANADLNGDGTIGASDLFILRTNWGKANQ